MNGCFMLGEQARREVKRAASGEWHDNLDRPGRVALRESAGRNAEHGAQQDNASGNIASVVCG
jgi:hypothetical protein